MSRPTKDHRKTQALEIEQQILVMGVLAEVVIDQQDYVGSDLSPQLNKAQIEAVTDAIRIISDATHSRFCQLMIDLGVPA